VPKNFQRGARPVKDVAFGLDDIGNALRVRRRRKFAPAVAAVLPQLPKVPRRCSARLATVICQPEPTLRQNTLVCGTYFGAAESLPEMVFARVNARVFSGLLADSFDESDRLSDAHGAAGIMTVFLKIEHQQDSGGP